MINAELPNLPASSVSVEQPVDPLQQPVGLLGASIGSANKAKLFSYLWYRFFNKLISYLQVLQESPQQIDQAALSAFGTKLGADMSGLVIWVPAPYDHLLVWDGSAWSFAPGDSQSGFTATFPTPPTGNGWRPCDGSTADYLLADGTLGSQVLPTTASLYFRQ